MDIGVREAHEADLEGILELHRQEDMDGGKVLPVEQARSLFNRMKTYPDYKVYVAEADGEIIGTFALAVMDNLAHMGAPSGLIEDVVVKTGLQGLGVGKKMMAFAMDYCKERGCYKVALSSNLKRERAHDFYESLGYKKHGYSFLLEV